MFEPAKTLPLPDPIELACDQAIAACGGDLRGAVKALLLANEYLEHELTKAQAIVAASEARASFLRNSTFDPDDAPPRDRRDWYD